MSPRPLRIVTLITPGQPRRYIVRLYGLALETTTSRRAAERLREWLAAPPPTPYEEHTP